MADYIIAFCDKIDFMFEDLVGVSLQNIGIDQKKIPDLCLFIDRLKEKDSKKYTKLVQEIISVVECSALDGIKRDIDDYTENASEMKNKRQVRKRSPQDKSPTGEDNIQKQFPDEFPDREYKILLEEINNYQEVRQNIEEAIKELALEIE